MDESVSYYASTRARGYWNLNLLLDYRQSDDRLHGYMSVGV